MNKTFKRVLASMLAILMIVCSMPFTVFAAENNRKWWVADGVDPSTIKAEPEFWGLNYEGDPDYEPWGSTWGEQVTLEDGYDDHRDHFKPIFAFTVSDLGTKGNIDEIRAKYHNHYAYDSSRTFEAAMADGTIIDPTNLKAGQRIAVTFELGGIDALNSAQIQGNYNEEYIKAGFHNGDIGETATRDKWTYAKESNKDSSVRTANNLYAEKGGLGFAGNMAYEGEWKSSVACASFMAGSTSISQYIGANMSERPFASPYGIVDATVYFEVQKDCSLLDENVFSIQKDDGGALVEPYYRMDSNIGEKNYLVTIDDTPYTFANAAVVWTIPNGGSTECEHEWTLTETTTPATCSAEGKGTYTCTKCAETKTDAIAIDANAHVYTNFVSNNDATCLADGTKTAACDLNADHAKKTIDDEGSKLDHDYATLTPTDGTHHTATCVNGCNDTTDPVACTFTVVDHKDATVTEEGYDKYECACGNSYTETLDKITCEHKNTTESKETTQKATCSATGTEVVTVTCNDCGALVSETTNTLDKLPHTEKVVVGTPATCTATGLTDGKVCDVCGEVLVEQTVIEKAPHTEKVVTGTPATCTATGLTDGKVCDVCGEVLVEQTVIEKAPHTEKVVVGTPATCTATGLTDGKVCDVCGEVLVEQTVIDAIGHDYEEVEGSAIAPTVDAEGKEADQKCKNCGDVITGKAIAMIPSYNITVAATDFGKVTLNGVEVTDGATVKVAAQTEIKLVAEANDGSKFLGWVANGLTTVSTDATFTTVALADVTYAPVFEKADDTTFTVVFADGYGNIISSQAVTNAADVVIPDAPARSGYVFAGWTMTEDEIHALTSSATIVAMFELDESANYTVTAAGATITGDGIDATDVAENVPYDTLVTVTKEGAKAWSVNGVTVAYGDTYSFYVGKDIEVVAVMEGVDAVPMVGNVGTKEVSANGKIKVQFIATRTMADGYTYIDSGFVYGKGDLGNITLDDVDGKAVKAAYTKTASEQFSVSYGLSAQSGTMTARAFIAFADADGKVEVTYATPMTYTYA